MTEVKHAGGIVSSSKVPALHLIPTEALLCLADRFQVGTERKGDGAWNALTKNQQCLDDNAFLIERCSHIIRHTMLLRDQLAHGFNDEEDSPYENAGAIIFGGALMACAMARAKAEMHFSCAMCGCGIPWGTTSCKDCMEYACEAVGMPVGYVPPEKRAEDPTAWVQLDPGGMTGTVVESPDDWVVQDRCPYRPDLDEYRYLFSGKEVGGWTTTSSLTNLHGHVDSFGDKLEIRCRRKDLPLLESPDDWVVQDRVPARATDRGAWVDRGEEYPAYDFSSRHWWTVGISAGLELEDGSVDAVGRTLHLICRRKDLPELPLTPFSLTVGPKYECRNGQTVGPLNHDISGRNFFGSIYSATWTPTGRAMKVDVGMSDEAERGWDIVKLVRE